MRSHRILLGGVGIAALATGYFLVPRPEERVTMLARDGLYESASKELSLLQNSGDQRPDVLIQTHLLREKQGDPAGALAALEAYLQLRPNDIAAREKQAGLLRQAGLLDRHFKALEILTSLSPSRARVTRLLELYRLHSRFDDELRLLQTYAGSKYLDAPQLARLGAILAGRGDWHGAQHWLELVDKGASVSEAVSASGISRRLLLFDVLARAGHVDLANAHARTWATTSRSPDLVGKLITRMARAGLAHEAAQLARTMVDVLPESAFDIAGVLTKKGHSDISRQMLARWSDREAAPNGDQLRDYVYASMQAGDALGPFGKLTRLIQDGAEPIIQARMAEELAHAFGCPALAPLRPLLSTEVLQTRPLFAADLAIFEGNPQLASWFLDQVDLSQLEPRERPLWLTLLQNVESRPAVFERLTRLWAEKRLPPELLRAFADEAQQFGRPNLHAAIWRSVDQ